MCECTLTHTYMCIRDKEMKRKKPCYAQRNKGLVT